MKPRSHRHQQLRPSPGSYWRLAPTALILSTLFLSGGLATAGNIELPKTFPGSWRTFGRTEITTGADWVRIANGSVANLDQSGDYTMSFRARAVDEKAPVQIWGAVRVPDRENRYVFGLRGGVEPQLSFARYAADGRSRNLGFAPLEFKPEAAKWYRFRVSAQGRHFQVYLNDEALPRINVVDDRDGWDDGGVALGGGWLPTEFAEFNVQPLRLPTPAKSRRKR